METKEVILITIGIVIFTVLITVIPAYFIGKANCLKSYENYQPNFSIFGGCRVMWKDKLTPVDIIREIN